MKMSERSERDDEMDIDIKEEFYQLASDGINYERIPEKYLQPTISQSTEDIPLSLRCRLCAIQNDDMIDIFSSHETEGNIGEKIAYCLRISVNEADNLPNRICWFCSEELELCYQFNKIVEEAEKQLLAVDNQIPGKVEETEQDSESATIVEEVPTTSANNLIGVEEEISSNDENPVDSSTFDLNSGRTSSLDIVQQTNRTSRVSRTSSSKSQPLKQTSSAQCKRGLEDQGNPIVPGGTETKKRRSRCMSAGIETEVQVRSEDSRPHVRRLKKTTEYFCSMCNKPFKHLSTLELHMAVHSDERPWECDYCKKSFKTKGHLQRHLTVCKNRPEANGAIHKYLAEQYKEQSIGPNPRRSLFSASSEPSARVLDHNGTICVNNLTKDGNKSSSDNERQKLDSPTADVNPGRPTTLVTVQRSNCNSRVSTMTCAKSQAHEERTSSARCEKKTEDHLVLTDSESSSEVSDQDKTSCFSEVSTTSCRRPQPNKQTSPAQCGKGSEDVCIKQKSLAVTEETHTRKRRTKCYLAGVESKVKTAVTSRVRHKRCDKSSIAPSDLKRYPMNLETKKFDCFLCDKSFKNFGTVKAHMLVHSDQRSWECDYCKKRCKRKGNLLEHIRFCQNRIHKCKFCATLFETEADLVRHVTLHTKELPYSCGYCGKKYTFKQNRDRHHRVHDGKRPFKCSLCAKTFNWAGGLQRHALVHSDEKKFPCFHCDKSYKRAKSRKIHIATVHVNVKV